MDTGHIDRSILFIAVFAVYLITLCPTVYVGDSGELTAAALSLGIAHPPGYPVYVILGKVFSTLIPGAPSAYEMNLFSAFFGALSAVMLYNLMRVLGTGRIVGIATGALLAFLNPFWSQAVVARVYTLNAFLMITSLYFLFRYRNNRRRHNMYGYFLFLGFGLANHPISIITLPVSILVFLSVENRKKYEPVTWLNFVLWSLPGAAMYLYLPLRSMTNPAINWGNPGKGKRLIDFVLRSEYWTRVYVENLTDAYEVIRFYLGLIPGELLYAGVLFLAVGILYSFRKQGLVAVCLVLIYVFNIFFMILHASRSDIFYWPRYIIPSFLSIVIWTGLGFDAVIKQVSSIRSLPFIALVLPVALAVINFHENDRSQHRLAEEFNMHILNDLPDNSALMAQGDNVLFPITYFHHVKGVRPDMKLFEVGMNQLAAFEFHPKKTPTFFTHYNNLGTTDLQLVPDGLVYKVITPDMDAPSIMSADELLEKYELTTITGSKPVYLDYLSRCMVGDYYFMLAVNVHRKSFADALPLYLKAAEAAYDNDVVQYNLGLVFGREQRYFEAMQQFKKVLAIDRKNRKAPQYIAHFGQLTNKQAAARQRPADPFESAFSKAQDAFERGDVQKAKQFVEQALTIRPNAVSALNNLATIYILLGDYERALAIYNQILVLEPDNEVAQKNTSWLNGLQKTIEMLVDQNDTKKAIELLLGKADASVEAGSPHEAVFFANAALSLAPDNTAIHEKLGDVYRMLRLHRLATRHYNEILTREPDNKRILKKINTEIKLEP